MAFAVVKLGCYFFPPISRR